MSMFPWPVFSSSTLGEMPPDVVPSVLSNIGVSLTTNSNGSLARTKVSSHELDISFTWDLRVGGQEKSPTKFNFSWWAQLLEGGLMPAKHRPNTVHPDGIYLVAQTLQCQILYKHWPSRWLLFGCPNIAVPNIVQTLAIQMAFVWLHKHCPFEWRLFAIPPGPANQWLVCRLIW